MQGIIFYRERGKVGEGEKKPRFKLLAVSGADIRFYGKHLRRKELDQIASAVGARLVMIERSGESDEDVEIKD
ncbi:MAG TPA: hypothetical protein PLR20_09775 [Syntrophales bacterium]|nr:hypothetical protein [Syntrophales bacterium]HOX93166.1 hypothetical protein [Syntrophales bacterium]HPI57655.1 hypothetical protein [Syntrophales bacterium]HPN25332.1 hypothetical protein [Syntrophales bacterium]HQM29624.1 hypothetical protein [Syntrophales bacterium]